jgi:LCP family protein required for cell wall assembly
MYETQEYHTDDPLAHFQPIQIEPKPKRRLWRYWLPLAVFLAVYLLFPQDSTLLVLGIDRAPEGTAVGRSDTNILVRVDPLRGHVSLLSIPRDLWVAIPGYGENRINTAHFFGEGEQAGHGPELAIDTIEQDFGVRADYYLRIQLERFPAVVDALGGIDIDLPTKMAGLSKGKHHLDGEQALAFVRNRAGTDDFYRMQQGQIFIKALIRNLLNPLKWIRLPFFLLSLTDVVDTDIPVWQWPRLGVAVLRAGLTGLGNHTLDRDMVTPWITADGASVLLPNWERILPLVQEIFK